jgi:hypothetical protein
MFAGLSAEGATTSNGRKILAEFVATLMAAKAGRCLLLRRFRPMVMLIARSLTAGQRSTKSNQITLC